LAGLFAASCSTAPDKKEIGALGDAARSFHAEATASSPVPAARAARSKAWTLAQLADNAPIEMTTGCGDDAQKANRVLVTSPGKDEEDAAYEALASVATCGLYADTGVAGGTSSQAADSATLKAIFDYCDGLQAIADAADTNDVIAATQKLSTSLTSLASAVDAPPRLQAAPAFFAKLAQIGLANAQYRALRHFVLEADPLFDPAQASLVRDLRIRRAIWIQRVAIESKSATEVARATLNDRRLMRRPRDRLAYFDRMQPVLADLAAQQAAAQSDPKSTVGALVQAHHKLATVLRTNKGQFASVASAVIDIASGGQALLASGKPASK
jgi:hypothetical protein